MDYARPIIRRQAGSVFRDVTAEPLETRRLMAGIGMRPPMIFSLPNGETEVVMSFFSPRFERQQGYNPGYQNDQGESAQQPQAAQTAGLSVSQTRVAVTDPVASPSAAVSNESAVASNTSVPVTIAVNHLPAAKTTADDADGVDQLIADTSATPAAAAVAAPAAVSTNAGETEHVFGPFTLQTQAAQGTTPNVTLASLLSGDDSVTSAFRWQNQDATYRPRRSAEPTAQSAEETVMPQVVTKSNANQATLLPMSTETAVQSIWERVVLMSAATMMLVMNWIVRRRRQQTSLMAIYRRR